MKWLKKITATPLETIAKVIDSLDAQTNERTNAPSIRAVRDAIEQSGSAYPIGSIYMSVNEVDPADLFGGEWTQIKDKFLLASGDTYSNGATGGEARHFLTSSEMPSHSHTYSKTQSETYSTPLDGSTLAQHNHSVTIPTASSAGGDGTGFVTGTAAGIKKIDTENTGLGDGHDHTVDYTSTSTGNTGGAQAHNNMPPYLAVNVWVRTA